MADRTESHPARPGEVGTGWSFWLPVHVGVGLALFLASLDAAIAQLVAPSGLPIHPALGGLLPLVLLAYLAGWLVVCWPLGRWGGLAPAPLEPPAAESGDSC